MNAWLKKILIEANQKILKSCQIESIDREVTMSLKYKCIDSSLHSLNSNILQLTIIETEVVYKFGEINKVTPGINELKKTYTSSAGEKTMGLWLKNTKVPLIVEICWAHKVALSGVIL